MLKLSDISKQYKTGELVQQALDGVSFCLRDSEFVSVLGPSGSGKTTLLNIIGGLDRYDSGDLIINGISTENYKNKDWDAYRNHTIGFVFQSYNLIAHQSVLANVELALTIGGMSVRERRKKAKKALEDVGLGDQIHKRPNQLSGGQMQRVAIARALVNDPDILLADEPTGALDSGTSVQIMELLKQVAAHRLVVMVTHNADLAEEYSTRIIQLKDGRVVSDSNPYDPDAQGEDLLADSETVSAEKAILEKAISEEAISEKAIPENEASAKNAADRKSSKKEKKRARMSFFTSLALSANNLRSKMGRTVLISLACSIGIIGIALILSISTGVNGYIYDIQKDTMSSYPITISAMTIDINGLMEDTASMREEFMNMTEGETPDDGAVHTDYSNIEASESFSASMVENNLTDFKKFLDDPDNEIHDYLGENGVVYTYDVSFDVYTRDPEGNLMNTNASTEDITDSGISFAGMSSGLNFMRSNMFSWNKGTFSSAYNFSEMTSGGAGQAVSQVIIDNYDLVYGKWPEAYDEVVLILTRSNTIPAETLYQLGIMKGSEYKELAEDVKNGDDLPDYSWNYEDLEGHTFYLITASDHYMENEDGTFSYIDDSFVNISGLMENAIELKVVGIIRPGEDASISMSTAVGYTSGLTEYCISHTQESSVVKAQGEQADINVLTGLKFAADTDEQKAKDAIEYINNMSSSEKAQLYQMIMYYETGEEAREDLLEEGSSLSDLFSMFGMDQDSSISMIMSMFGNENLEKMMSSIGNYISDEGQLAILMDKWLEESPDEDILIALYDQYLMGGSYEENMNSFGMVSYDAPTSISLYTDTFADKDSLVACIDKYNSQADPDNQIVYTDYIALITSSVTSIVNAISYVLIAFVAISLIVSCIMIGIITHISVLERTKEIGILRALGASRSNISHVFNAETVIIGLISGLIGILISVLLTIPINLVLKILLGSSMINVHLPVLYALLLIAISVAVTVIGGIIPAAKAAKKDPVIALRTE